MANIAGIMELYTAYFNRAADKNGVDYWANEMDTKGWTLDDVANSFAQQTEYTALYAGKTNAEIVALVYTNVLNRAADTDGAAYWEAELTSGSISVSQLIQAVVNAATEMVDGAYKHATDAAIVDNKTAVSQAAYDGGSQAKNISLSTVTATDNSAALAAVDAVVNVGTTFALKASTAGEILVGTTKNDTFTGDKDSIDATDKLVDSSTTDNDTANLTFNDSLGTITAANIENVNVTIANTTASRIVDATNFSGVENLTVNRANVEVGGSTIAGGKEVVVSNLDATKVAAVTAGSNVTKLTVNQTPKAGVVVNADTVTTDVTTDGAATVNAAIATGTITVDGIGTTAEDAKAVVIKAAKAATISVGQTQAITGSVSVDAAAATTVDVTAAGGATIIAGTTSTTTSTIKVTSIDDSGVTITSGTGAGTTATTDKEVVIELSGTTGTTDVATVNAAGAVSIDAGKTVGTVDTLNLTGTTAAATYTITNTQANGIKTIAGSGDQLVNVTADRTVLNGVTVSGIETLKVTAAAAAATDLSKVTVSNIEIASDFTGNQIKVKDGAKITLTADQTTELEIAANAADASITIAAGDDNGTSTATPDLTVTTLNLASTGAVFKNVTLDSSVGKITAATSTDATATTTITVTGSNDVTLGAVTAKSVDASALTGKLLGTTMGDNLTTLTSGAGADNITLNSTTVAHKLVTGAGIDTITITNTKEGASIDAGEGNDIISIQDADAIVVVAGDGDDSITIGASTATIESDAIIVGGAGTDTLVIDTNAGAALDLSGKTNFAISGIEKLNITDLDNTLTLSAAQLAQNSTLELIGSSNDTFAVVAKTTADENVDLSNVTIGSGSAVVIDITGNAKANVITGTAKDDTINATAGADTIDGGAGTDTYLAATAITETGSANASLGVVVNMGSTTVTGLSVYSALSVYTGNAVDVAAGTVAHLYAANVSTNSTIVDTISNIENITGTSEKDYIIGSSADNVINGGSEADYIDGGAGADTINGGAGADTIKGGDGNDIIIVSSTEGASDTIDGGADTDTIRITTASADLSGATISNVEKYDLSADGLNVTLSNAQVATLNTAAGTVTGTTSGSNVEMLVVKADGAASTVDVSAITFTNSAATFTLDHADDAFTGDTGNDVIIIGTAAVTMNAKTLDLGTGTDSLVAGGTSTVDLTSATLTSIETLNLVSGSVNATVQVTADQKNAFTTITADGSDTLLIDTLSGKTVAGTAAVDKFIFAATDASVTISSFNAGASSDVINVNAFLGATVDSSGTTTANTIGVDGTAGDVVLFAGGAAEANVALLYNAAGTIADDDVVGAATGGNNGEIVMGNDQKAVIFVATGSTATTANMYYVTAGSTAGTSDTVTLVGTVSLATGDTLADFVVGNLA